MERLHEGEPGAIATVGGLLMDLRELYVAVHWTARVSSILFAASLALPALRLVRAAPARALYVGFIVAHTVHFGFVFTLAQANGGANMFPGGRSIADAGGWAAVAGILAFFYALAFVGLAGRIGEPGRWRHRLARGATTFLGYMFVSTYVPLIERSVWFILPAIAIAIAVLLDLGRGLRGESSDPCVSFWQRS